MLKYGIDENEIFYSGFIFTSTPFSVFQISWLIQNPGLQEVKTWELNSAVSNFYSQNDISLVSHLGSRYLFACGTYSSPAFSNKGISLIEIPLETFAVIGLLFYKDISKDVVC